VLTRDEKLHEIIPIPADLPQSPAAHPPDPTDLALTADHKRCYVIDNDNHRLLIRENDTGQWKAMGRQGRSLGQFQYPFTVCLGTENYVYICESMGARIQRISPTDRWSGLIGSWGVELGKFYRPKGVVADGQGKIFVSDSTLQVIQVFGPWGRIKGALCDQLGNLLRFEHPMGMCFDAKGRLYVVELGADRVAIVNLSAPADSRNSGSNSNSERKRP
jgi:sugar lactone lactonase YvrE